MWAKSHITGDLRKQKNCVNDITCKIQVHITVFQTPGRVILKLNPNMHNCTSSIMPSKDPSKSIPNIKNPFEYLFKWGFKYQCFKRIAWMIFISEYANKSSTGWMEDLNPRVHVCLIQLFCYIQFKGETPLGLCTVNHRSLTPLRWASRICSVKSEADLFIHCLGHRLTASLRGNWKQTQKHKPM